MIVDFKRLLCRVCDKERWHEVATFAGHEFVKCVHCGETI